jgi:hypothetical protein
MREEVVAAADDRWERAQRHLGRLESREAGFLLDELAAEQPRRFDVAQARYRVARNAGDARAAQARAIELLRLPATTAQEAQAQAALLGDCAAGAIAVDAATRALLFDRWLALGRLRDAEALLAQDAAVPRAEQAQHWFRLALSHGEQQAPSEWRRQLLAVIERYPDLPQADKARFLLANA